MKSRLKFPRVCQPKHYYSVHPAYVKATAEAAGIAVELVEDTTIESCTFGIEFDGVKLAIDYGDSVNYAQHWPGPIFKFHCITGHPPNIRPFPTVSFFNWPKYRKLAGKMTYKAAGDMVVCRQSIGGDAIERRSAVHAMLKEAYGENVETNTVGQQRFWREVETCLVSVCVPGQRNDILDRGHFQYIAFGCCTIAPEITTLLPGFRRLVPGEHYVGCRGDYSALLERVEWCRDHRGKCREIGANAKRLFEETSMPAAIWQWVQEAVA